MTLSSPTATGGEASGQRNESVHGRGSGASEKQGNRASRTGSDGGFGLTASISALLFLTPAG